MENFIQFLDEEMEKCKREGTTPQDLERAKKLMDALSLIIEYKNKG